jgi:5-oxoprolinase (ATP-hydrolysing) subunit A
MNLDLNCDLGEGEPLSRTRALMRRVTSANIVCGGHAGDLSSMRVCLGLAKELEVRAGAHPGWPNRPDFGRGPVAVRPDELELLLLQQVGSLERLARAQGVRLHHVKLHGTLYHATEQNPALRRRYVECVSRWWPGLKIYALAGGTVARLAGRRGLTVWEEGFLDRAYQPDGTLRPRTSPGALLNDLRAVRARLLLYRRRGEIETVSGGRIRLHARTWCLHSDTPLAPALAREAARVFQNRKAP